MASFLKIFSGFCLFLIWVPTIFVFFIPLAELPPSITPQQVVLVKLAAIAIAIVSSVAPVALYAFGRLVGDVRAVREHLSVMRRYYEPDRGAREL
jgi:hypothetical protein